MSTSTVLVTGASGYLGGRVVHQLLKSSDDTKLLLAVRSGAARDALAGALTPYERRLCFLDADLESAEPFAAITDAELATVTHIVHAAAVTRFNVERDLAQRINVDGTAHVMALARRCPRLEMLGYVSTLYATGLRDGDVTEQLYDEEPGFANAYEWSKWSAEQLVPTADLPWQILRVATVVADDSAGTVTQLNAFHETLKLCFYGLLSLLPGHASTPLYLVTGEFVAQAVTRLVTTAGASGVFHVTHDRAAAPTLSEVLDIVFAHFDGVDDFRRKRILRPLLADRTSFDLLVDGVSPVAGSLVTQALTNVAPFAHQLYVDKAVDTARLKAAIDVFPTTGVHELVGATTKTLVETRWGRRAAG